MIKSLSAKIGSSETILMRTAMLPYRAIMDLPFEIDEIYKILNQQYFLDALLISSPTLYRDLLKWFNLKDKSINDKEVLAALKYYIRMAGRATPFGMFSGISVLSKDESGNFVHRSNNSIKKFARLDYTMISKICKKIKSDESFRNKIRFYTNQTFRIVSGNIRLISQVDGGSEIIYELIQFPNSEMESRIIEFAQNGITIPELLIKLNELQYPIDVATKLIDKAITNYLLISEFDNIVTSNELSFIIDKIEKMNVRSDENLNDIFKTIDMDLKKIRDDKVCLVDGYRNILSNIEKLKLDNVDEPIIRIDFLNENCNAKLDNDIVDCVKDAVGVLLLLSSQTSGGIFVNFIEEFKRRYEDQEILLLDALDPEMGIVYGNPDSTSFNKALHEYNFAANNTKGDVNIKWTKADQFIFDKYCHSLSIDSDTINIEENELKTVVDLNSNYEFGPSFSAVLSVSEIGESENVVRLLGVNNGSASRLISRFSHMDKRISNLLTEIRRHEDNAFEPCVLAEVVHLQDYKFGNISSYDSFRLYEIPILTCVSDPTIHTVKLNDLYIFVDSNRLKIKSRTLECEIIPILSTAVNYSFKSMPVYKFLVDFGYSYWPLDFSFNWGSILSSQKVLPRITYNKIVLSPKIWNFKRNELNNILDGNLHELLSIVHEWRIAFRIPEFVSLRSDEEELLIVLSNLTSVLIFRNIIKKLDFISISESFDKISCKETRDQKINQFVVSFFNYNTKVSKLSIASQGGHVSVDLENSKVVRKFLPTDRWIYFKIYCAESFANNLIANYIRPIIFNLKSNKNILRFFYIRYSDPEFHIRLRLYIDDSNLLPMIISLINSQIRDLVNDGFVKNISIETYSRELERYGLDTMEFSEEIFDYDSTAIMSLISSKSISLTDSNSIIIAINNVDRLLGDFEFSIFDKQLIMKKYIGDFETNDKWAERRRDFDKIFRKNRIEIEHILRSGNLNIIKYTDVFMALNRRSFQIKKLMTENNFTTSNIENNIMDYIHMSLNRLNSFETYYNEQLVTYLLKKGYNVLLAQSKYQKLNKN